MDKDIIAVEVNAEYLKGFIYYVRGVRVMLDRDLAKSMVTVPKTLTVRSRTTLRNLSKTSCFS